MNKSTVTALLASLTLATISPLAAFAQGGAATPPPAPPTAADEPEAVELDLSQFQMPQRSKPLADSWDAADRGDDAVKKAQASLDALAKAYQSAPSLTDKVVLGMRDARPEEKSTLDVSFGPKDAFRMVGGPMTLSSAEGAIFLEVAGNDRKYLMVPVTTTVQDALLTVLPSPLPFPLVQLRHGAEGEKLIEALVTTMGGPINEAKVSGFRSKDGKNQVLLVGANGDMVLSIDPNTHLLHLVEAVMEPEGSSGANVAFEMGFDPKVVAALEPAITAPAPNGRKTVATMKDLMMPIAIGEPAIDFSLSDNTGKMVSLSDLKGNIVVLDFWATWCGPCQRALPKLNDFAKWVAESGKPVKVFGVDVWERVDAGERQAFGSAFWDKKGFVFPTLIDQKDALIGGYGFQGIPVTVVIGVDGRIAAVHEGFDPEMAETLKADVEKALAQGAAAGE